MALEPGKLYGAQLDGKLNVGGGTMYMRVPGYDAGAGAQMGPSLIDTGSGDMGIGAQFLKSSELDPQYEADYAATDVQNKYQRQLGSENRRLTAMGIDPSSGRARALNRNASIALAAAKAGAANKGRRNAKETNREWRFKAAQLMQRDRDAAWQRDKYMQDRADRFAQLNSTTSAINARTPVKMGGRSSAQRRAASTPATPSGQWGSASGSRKVGQGRLGGSLARADAAQRGSWNGLRGQTGKVDRSKILAQQNDRFNRVSNETKRQNELFDMDNFDANFKAAYDGLL